MADKVNSVAEMIEAHESWLRGGGDTGQRGDLLRLNMRDMDLRGAALIDFADMTDTDLRGANFTGASLNGADMWRANLKGAVIDPIVLHTLLDCREPDETSAYFALTKY